MNSEKEKCPKRIQNGLPKSQPMKWPRGSRMFHQPERERSPAGNSSKQMGPLRKFTPLEGNEFARINGFNGK
jgi:hypothetical protein